MYRVYIIYSKIRNRYYIGFTSDELSERLRKHNTNHKGFTGNAGDWKIMFFENFEMKEMATKRELELKSWKSRKKIELLINTRK